MEPNLTAAQSVLLIYGIFIIIGGVIGKDGKHSALWYLNPPANADNTTDVDDPGYLKAQSKASLIAGVTSGEYIHNARWSYC